MFVSKTQTVSFSVGRKMGLFSASSVFQGTGPDGFSAGPGPLGAGAEERMAFFLSVTHWCHPLSFSDMLFQPICDISQGRSKLSEKAELNRSLVCLVSAVKFQLKKHFLLVLSYSCLNEISVLLGFV